MGLVNVEVELLRVHADMRLAYRSEKDGEVHIPINTFRRWSQTLYTCSKDLEADRKRDD